MVSSSKNSTFFSDVCRVFDTHILQQFPQKYRTRCSRRCPSGRLSRRGRKRAIKSPQARVYIYKITSGRSGWPSRDPIEESGGLNLYGFANENPIQYYDAFGLQSLLTILECAQASPAYDFADCICAFAGDEDDCKKQMGGCLNAIGSKLMNKAIFHGPGPSG